VVIPISASDANKTVSITGAIPAQKITATVNAEQTLALTGMITVPKTKSQGLARFMNLSQGEVAIPKGTIISTMNEPRVRFVTLNDALFGKDNKFLDVKIESMDAGSSANVAPEAIKTVEGQLGFLLTVTNPAPTSGGSDMQAVGATDDDRAKLRESMLGNLRREAEAKMRAQIKSDDIFILDTLDVATVLEETFTPGAGQPGSALTLSMKADFSARYITGADLNQLALTTLSSSVPIDFVPISGVTVRVRGTPQTDSTGVTHFDLEALRPLMRTMDRLHIFSIARGRAPAEVKDELLKELSMRQPPEIMLSPSWWQWMPLIPFNVSVEVK
jgi:hypothetical protein